jgi:hypothetical protein
MTDYDPNHLKNFDRYGNAPFEPAATDTTRAPYVLLAILALIGLVGSALYFSGLNNPPARGDIAVAPETTLQRPAPLPRPTPAPPLARPDSGVTPPNQVTPASPEATPARPE